MDENKNSGIIPEEIIMSKILVIRGVKVMVDNDLADLYGVSTKRLNEQVKRNILRFPVDFMFQLTEKEKQEVVANCDHLIHLKFSPYLPFVFTEHGAVMLASVLNSERAILVNIQIVRIFIKIRQILDSNEEIYRQLNELQKKDIEHDRQILLIFDYLKQLEKTNQEVLKLSERKRIGFKRD